MDPYSRAVAALNAATKELAGLIEEYKALIVRAKVVKPEAEFAPVDAPYEFTETPGQYVEIECLSEGEMFKRALERSKETETLLRKFADLGILPA